MQKKFLLFAINAFLLTSISVPAFALIPFVKDSKREKMTALIEEMERKQKAERKLLNQQLKESKREARKNKAKNKDKNSRSLIDRLTPENKKTKNTTRKEEKPKPDRQQEETEANNSNYQQN